MVLDAPPLKLGLAGVGAGAHNLLRGIAASAHFRFTAVADIRPGALLEFAHLRTFTSVEDLCTRGDVDAIWVATPNALHAEHVIAALDHGKHVVVSKPMAVTLDECRAMNAAAERAGKILLAGHSQALATPIRKMAELVASGEYGRLAMIHTWHYTDWLYRPRLPDELDESRGGGVVFRQSPHQVDIVRVIAGEPVTSVRAATFDFDPQRAATGAYTAFLGFASGAAATLVYSGYGRLDAAELTFGQGRPDIRQARGLSAPEERAMKEELRVPTTGGHPFFGLTVATCERADLRQSPNGLFVYDDAGRREIEIAANELREQAELEELYEAVVHGRPPLHDGRWGQATHEVTLAIAESARLGGEISLPG